MQTQFTSVNFAGPRIDERGSLGNALNTGLLNQLLREQLNPAAKTQTTPQSDLTSTLAPQSLLSTATAAVGEILLESSLRRDILHHKLSELFYQQQVIYQQTDISPELRNRQYICQCGLIMSPDNCITTQLDDLRVRGFIRGIDAAVRELQQIRQGPLHIVYPACGPFAPLLMPLLGYYKAQQLFTAQQLRITLIDIQPGAVQCLEALIEKMGVKDYVRQICCMDALEYDPSEHSVDLVVLEAMQHGFSREGHLSIARHFAAILAPDGFIVPKRVTVTAVLNKAQREYVEQWQDAKVLSEQHMNPQIKAQRTVLGEVLSVTRDSLLELKERRLDEHTILIECGKVHIPMMPKQGDEQTLLLCTEIETFAGESIGEYDSGITHPLPDQQVCINFKPQEERAGDLLLNSGDAIRFFYRLNGLPGFLATWAPGDEHGE